VPALPGSLHPPGARRSAGEDLFADVDPFNALGAVGLPALHAALDDVAAWDERLSEGESSASQSRALLFKPDLR
jgi:ABC-type uncharacterized transport system fused permease/ATPase subunit